MFSLLDECIHITKINALHNMKPPNLVTKTSARICHNKAVFVSSTMFAHLAQTAKPGTVVRVY